MNAAASPARYRRVLLKLSGETLGGKSGSGFDAASVNRVCDELIELAARGVQVAVVIGGGNFFRGGKNESLPITRVRGDQMGMLCTVVNAMAMEQTCRSKGAKVVVQSSVSIPAMAMPYAAVSSIELLESEHIVIFAGGTGNTNLTTDTAASLRAVDIEADILLKATKVDGIFPTDPAEDATVEPYRSISYDQVLGDALEVMDLASVAICRERRLPIRVFNAFDDNAIVRAGLGESEGTLVSMETAQ